MKRFRLILGLVMVSWVFAIPLRAGGVKNYVATYGLDTNPCSIASPCRSLAHAVDATDAGGEVIVLDTGGYGTMTITKSISIIAVGMYASVTPGSGANGITVNAGAGDQILIKGLTIKGAGGNSGIKANTVGTLIVENCLISGLEGAGIYFTAPDSELVILNSKFYKNLHGVRVDNLSGSVSVSMNNVEMVNNANYGLYFLLQGTGSVSATVTHSLASYNSTGFVTVDTSSGTSALNLEHCIASGNTFQGVYSYGNSVTDVTRLSNCTVTGNMDHGIYKDTESSGTIYTRGNNTVVGNGTNSNVAPTAFSAW